VHSCKAKEDLVFLDVLLPEYNYRDIFKNYYAVDEDRL